MDANWNRETPPCFVFYANRAKKEVKGKVEVEAEAVEEEEAGSLNVTFRHLRESKNSFLFVSTASFGIVKFTVSF